MRVTFRGGPHDGETRDVDVIGNRLLFPGNWEDRRFAGTDDLGMPLWSYPTVVYLAEGFIDEQATYRYFCTEPAQAAGRGPTPST